MRENRSNQRNDSARNDNDAFGSPSRSGRGGSYSNRDDDDMLNRNARSGRSRSSYDSELNERMERGGSHTSAYGDEQSRSADRYRSTGGRGNRDRDMSHRDSRDIDDNDGDMGADSWGGGADRDTGRDRYNRKDRFNAASYNDRDDELDDERSDYYGNRSMKERGRDVSGAGGRGRNDEEQQWGNRGGRGGYSDRYSGREGGSNQFSSYSNQPSDMRSSSERGAASGMQRGQYAGRGPKGYRRDDSRITEDVNEALTHDAHLDASEIEVSVSGGEVTLTGTVDSREAKRHAEDIAESISGVNEVNNQIRVSKNGANAQSRPDSDSDRTRDRSASDRSSTMNSDKDSEHHSDKKASNKSGARDGTSTADGAMSAQGTGPSGASNTATANTNPVPKSIPSTQGTSAHKTGDKGAQ